MFRSFQIIIREFRRFLLKLLHIHDLMWIKIQEMQKYADIYLLQNYSTYFGYHRAHHHEY